MMETRLPKYRLARRGVALLLVLACVVLIALLITVFLASIGAEVKSSKLYANSSSVKLMAQSAVNLVMAEIRDATRDGTLCWASQPGMIRTYDNTGAVKSYYKLYSDDSMVTTTFDHTQYLIPDGTHSVGGNTVAWYNQPGVYVDLNEPISVNGTNQYPIVDGDSSDLVSYTFNSNTGTVGYSTTPLPPLMLPAGGSTVKVLGPLNLNQPAVAGFWLNDKTPVSANLPNQAPMPVKWLYVLQDGEMASPDSGSTGGNVTFTNSTIKPSSTNPIMGRIAFWTDDESSKININTASEGTYWDVPRSNSGYASGGYMAGTTSPSWAQIMNGIGTAPSNYNHGTTDNDLRSNIPVSHEFQRYPGHPAMTSLSTVLNLTNPETIYSVTPRLGPGGSVEGSILTSQDAPFTAVTPNGNPLFASVDEFLFQPPATASARALTSALGGGAGGLQTLDQNGLKKAKFFLTASSRSPDVNLFNQPRISIWPISLGSASIPHGTSVFDQLISFCSTVGSKLYYFQRTDPTDPSTDLPAAATTTGLGRNRALMEYLRYLMGQNIPGFGGNFAAKYSTKNPNVSGATATDRDQILTEMFDYIRTTDLRDAAVLAAGQIPYTYQISKQGSPTGFGQVVPILDSKTSTRGFGRFESIEGATILFIGCADSDDPNSLTASGAVTADPTTHAARRRIQMIFLPQFFDPSLGSVSDIPCFSFQIIGLKNWQVNGTALSLYSSAGISATQSTPQWDTDAGFFGDQLGFRQAINSYTTSLGPGTLATTAFLSKTVDVPKAAGTFTFTGGDITINILTPPATYSSATNPGTIVQQVVLKFPSTSITLPLPALAPSNYWDWDSVLSTVQTGPYNLRYFDNPSPILAHPATVGDPDPLPKSGTDYSGYNAPSAKGRLGTTSRNSFYNSYAWVTDYDTVRCFSAVGDIRLIAAQKDLTNPAKAMYAAVGAYTSSSMKVLGAHTLFKGEGTPVHGAVAGRLVANADYDSISTHWNNTSPGTNDNGLIYGNTRGDYPGGSKGINYYNFQDVFDPATGNAVNGVAMGKTASIATGDVPGDWDNGIAIMRDGPFINKADEGDEGNASYLPYSWKGAVGNLTLTTGQFTPNRLIPSAVMFGSLPSEVFANKSWQTLLFRPGPLNHRGLGTSVNTPVAATTAGTDQGPPYTTPPDHLLLDLFSMPVVEPYAISEPLSTAGRINMNYLMVPFTYINRDTGLRAVLKTEQVVSIADGLDVYYKQNEAASTYFKGPIPNGTNIRFPVNIDSTLSQFYTRRFNNNDIFRSPSEICDIDIVPYDTAAGGGTGLATATASSPTRANMDAYWATHRLTGDNSRERIYATLYPRLTTKSNTFTIHFRVQTLKPALTATSPPASWQQWHEGADQITGEYRGSQTIERYVDPNDSSIPDFAASPSTSVTLAPYYKFRVLSVKQFAP